jgi:hypothetical protein
MMQKFGNFLSAPATNHILITYAVMAKEFPDKFEFIRAADEKEVVVHPGR